MQTSKAYYVGTHRYSSRAGEPAEIVGVQVVVPTGRSESRPCFHLRYKDGHEDFCPTSDKNNYEIISQKQLDLGEIPTVTH